jgi:tetratricopeptide (TPR) repeat protein
MKLALALLCVAATAHADVVRDAATPAERALLARLDAEQYVKARDEAEAILAASPDSFVAAWAMTLVHHNEEGNHARALYFVRRAEDILRRRYGDDPSWAKKALLEEIDLLYEMDRNLEVLKLIDQHDARFGATREELRIWPLFKLGRLDEARAIATRLAASDDWNEKLDGYNGMIALEFEAHDRAATYKWAVDAARVLGERSCVILRNAAGSAYTAFRLAEAEDLALRAHKGKGDCVHGGYDQLAGIYILEGEFQKAVSALDTLKSERLSKRLRPQFALTRRTILVDLLAALGKVEDAEKIAGELYALPERTGLVSTSKEMERFTRSFRYYQELDTRLVLLREAASYGPLFGGLKPVIAKLLLTRWEMRRALIQLAAEGDLMDTLVRPNLNDLNDLPAWRVGALVDVVGAGVMRAAIAGARRRDAAFPEAGAYLDAFAGEIAWREGDMGEADRLAARALAGLPREEALMRWRTMAWRADALRRLGKLGEARPLYQEVLGKLPSALRFLDLQLPVRVDGDGGDAARRVARSSRFLVEDGAPFVLRVRGKGICLLDDAGFQFACGDGVEAFHAAAFSPKVSLTQTDLSSLDGTPVRVEADTLLKGVLEP